LKQLTVRLDDASSQALEIYAARIGLKPATAIRSLVYQHPIHDGYLDLVRGRWNPQPPVREVCRPEAASFTASCPLADRYKPAPRGRFPTCPRTYPCLQNEDVRLGLPRARPSRTSCGCARRWRCPPQSLSDGLLLTRKSARSMLRIFVGEAQHISHTVHLCENARNLSTLSARLSHARSPSNRQRGGK
jgi:hypothetical protein